MNRLVYLCELDSVRDGGAETGKGVLRGDAFKAIYREIVKNGNSVVVTMNQLTDSKFFAQVFNDEFAYDCVLSLFEKGALRVSIYKEKNSNIRTASQYIQNALTDFKDAGSRFVFSNFPIKGEDSIDFKEIVLNALKYSDLSELKEMFEQNKETDNEYAARIEIIIRFINIVLKLSVCETANIPPKDEKSVDNAQPQQEDKTFSFAKFMEEIFSILREMKSDEECAAFYKEHREDIDRACDELGRRAMDMPGRKDISKRSAWLYQDNVKLYSGLTEEIVHICYNYIVEDSVKGVCEHFGNDSIKEDFYLKLSDYYERTKNATDSRAKKISKRKWKMLIRFAEYREGRAIVYDGKYSEVFVKDRLMWKGFMLAKSTVAFFWALIYAGVFVCVELINNFLEDTFSLIMPNEIVSALLNVLMFGILGSIIGIVCRLINKNRDVPDILDILIDIAVLFYDLTAVLIGGKKW